MAARVRIVVALATVLLTACAETPRAGFKRDYAAKRFKIRYSTESPSTP